jgi:glycosyltransferase involved in cell wall biosynthesis
MKVLHIIKQSGIAGAETYLLSVMPALQEKGVECTFLAMINPAFKEDAAQMTALVRSKGVKVEELVVERDFSFKMFRDIANIIEKGQFDLVVAHLIHAEFYATMVKRFYLKDLVIASVKHGYNPGYQTKYGFEPKKQYSDIFWWITKLNSGLVNRYCSISYGLKNLLVALDIVTEENIDVVHYGFNYDAVQYDTENLVKYRKTPHQILLVGRLIPVKGHVYAFNALKALQSDFPDACLVIIGSGPYEETLRAMVADLGIGNQVYFEGYQTNVHNYIKNSDLILIPSLAEGFCAVVLEAYHNLSPVMAFDVPALNEIIWHNETGVIVKKFDHDDLVAKIKDVFERPDFYKSLARIGYEKLHSYFTIDRMIEETIAFYKATLSGGRRAK